MEFLKIGQMAKLNNISVQTLRYYEEINLLNPAYIDDMSGYRYYALSQSADLDIIIFLKRLDFTLDEIKDIIHNPNNNEKTLEAVNQRTKSLEKEKKANERKLQTIHNFNNSFNYFLKNKDECRVKIEKFPRRIIQTHRTDKNIYAMDMDEYEKSLRHFKYNLNQSTEDPIFYNIGSIMRKSKFEKQDYYSDEMFIFTDCVPDEGKHEIIPENYYAVSFCHLFENELEAINNLHTYLKKHNYKVVGDYICEVIHEFPYKKEGQRNMFIRLQVPVEL